MLTGTGLAPLADVPDGQRRDGPPELVIRGEHPVIAMPVLPRRRHEIGQASGRCLSADRAGVYSRSEGGGSGRVRRVVRTG
jgi:hypothetical protein